LFVKYVTWLIIPQFHMQVNTEQTSVKNNASGDEQIMGHP